MWCLSNAAVNEFVKRLKSGEITPEKLMGFESSDARRDYFASFLGRENASRVNALFESKFLLKDQQAGMIRAAEKLIGKTQELKRDIISRIERMDKILSPTDLKSFMSDLVAKKLGFGVTREQAAKIMDWSNKIKQGKSELSGLTGDKLFEKRMEVGRNMFDLLSYAGELKKSGRPVTPVGVVKETLGLFKVMKSSLDDSALMLQGMPSLIIHPEIWAKNAYKSLIDIGATFRGREMLRELHAELLSRENALNGEYAKQKMGFGQPDEFFPTQSMDKVPVVGVPFKASEAAFVGFRLRTAADIFDLHYKIAKELGESTDGIGMIANSMTGRGYIDPKFNQASDIANLAFFSPRKIKGDIDFLTAHVMDSGKTGTYAKKVAAKNLIKYIIGQAMIMGAVNGAKAAFGTPGTAETDTRSADLGKVKLPNGRRYDFSGGKASMVVLASRMAHFLASEVSKAAGGKEIYSMKSSTTGILTPLNSRKYGGNTGMDVVWNYFSNKASPGASTIIHMMRGKDFQGNKPTFWGEVRNLFMPFPIDTAVEGYEKSGGADALLSLLASGVGLNTSIYQAGSNWNLKTSQEMAQFKERVGQNRFDELNKEANTKFNEWLDKAQAEEKYKSLSEEDKLRLVQDKADEIKKSIFSRFAFKPKDVPKKVLPKI